MPATLLDPVLEQRFRRIAKDPALFIKAVFAESPWSKQRQILHALQRHRKVAVVGCHAPGKSWLASRYAIYKFVTRPNTRIITTAPSWHQVDAILWTEIRKANQIARSRGIRLQRSDPQEQPLWKTKKAGHYMEGFSSDKPANLQGIHEREGLLILDEAAGIDEALWPALRSILAGSGWQALALGNPDTRDCEFFKVVGSKDWHTIKISAFDCPNFTGEDVPRVVMESTVSREYEQEMGDRYGADSPIYGSKIKAEFPADSADVLIMTAWLDRAEQREAVSSGELAAGLDVARQGGDRSALSIRRGNVMALEGQWNIPDLEALSQAVDRRLTDLGFTKDAPIAVDADGIGAGAADKLRSSGWNVIDFHGAAAVPDSEQPEDGIILLNQRALGWWHFRFAVRDRLSLRPDNDVHADLEDIRYAHKRVGHRIVLKIEEKDEIRARKGRSPDAGDSAMMAEWAMERAGLGNWFNGLVCSQQQSEQALW